MNQPLTSHYAAADGYDISYRRYDPPDGARPPVGIVVYLHGIQSHGGWYGASCQWLARAGLRVYAPDRRGSGQNEQMRGHCQSWEQLADDVLRLEDLAEAEFLADYGSAAGDAVTSGAGATGQPAGREAVPRDLASPAWYRRPPVVLLGVSWGGKLAAALAAMHGGRYAGIALLCPGIKPQRDVKLSTKFAIAKAVLGGKESQKFAIPLNDPALFTATQCWLDFLHDDKIALKQATAKFLFESRRLDGYLQGAGRWLREPLLVMLAGQDRIIDNAATMAYAGSSASGDLTVRLYGEAHHTLEFEPDPRPIFADLACWCVARCQEYQG